jgi:hypothetical protein
LTDDLNFRTNIRMKTTIDLPDEILQRAKLVAVKRKTTLDELVIIGLEYATSHSASAAITGKERANRLIAALQARNTEPMSPLTRDEIYDRQDGRFGS